MASTPWRTARLAATLALIASLVLPTPLLEAKDTHHHHQHDEHAEAHDDHHDHHHDHKDTMRHEKDHHHEEGDHQHQHEGDHHDHKGDHHDHEGHKSCNHHHHEHKQADTQNRWLEAYASAASMSVISFAGCILMVFFGMPKIQATVEYMCLAFAGTVLVADALLHLLPHALEGADHETMTTTGVAGVVGALSILIVPEIFGDHGHSHGDDGDNDSKVAAYGYANLFVEMIHNFVDGISIGLSWMAGGPAGLSATIAVAVHELPQELGDFVVLRAAGFSVPRLLFFNFMASLTCVGGVGLAHYIGQEATVPLQKNLMAFTAGSFLTLSLNMIFPQVSESIKKHHKGSLKNQLIAKLLCLIAAFLAVVILIRIGDLEEHDHGHEGHGHGHSHGHAHGHQHGVKHVEM